MIEYLSYSSINLYLSCAENWRRKYVLKEPTMSTIPLIFGSAFHATIEGYIEHKHKERTAPDIAALWDSNWRAKVETKLS